MEASIGPYHKVHIQDKYKEAKDGVVHKKRAGLDKAPTRSTVCESITLWLD